MQKIIFKNATGVDTSDFAKKTDLAHLKPDVDKLGIDKFKNSPNNLRNFKSKIDKLDIEKLETSPVDLIKLSNVVTSDVVKNTEYNELVQKVNNISTTDSSNLVKKTDYKTKVSEIENKITADHDKSVTTGEFNKLTSQNFAARLAEDRLQDIANLVKRQILMIN